LYPRTGSDEMKKALPDAAAQAQRFARVREAHRTEVQEDYVELIADLIAAKGEARAADLAERLGVSAATVTKTLMRLKRDGLIDTEPYRSIFLTAAGAEMAGRSKARHELVVAFLVDIGVPLATAEIDAEGVEHHLSAETLAVMRNRLERSRSRSGPDQAASSGASSP